MKSIFIIYTISIYCETTKVKIITLKSDLPGLPSRKSNEVGKKLFCAENLEQRVDRPPAPALPKLYSVTVAGDRYHRMSCGNLRGREGEEGLRYCNKYPRNCCALCSVWKAGKLCCSV